MLSAPSVSATVKNGGFYVKVYGHEGKEDPKQVAAYFKNHANWTRGPPKLHFAALVNCTAERGIEKNRTPDGACLRRRIYWYAPIGPKTVGFAINFNLFDTKNQSHPPQNC
mmetsp:Transcript_12269/g.19953  ORF Transcript_12269/g.19953 Transcript_12269/m.19953 type:complete len:111 (-) Transcript_12269:607-939(-)